MAITLSRVMKKAAASSSVILPLSNRTTILNTPLNTITTVNHHHFSALSDRKPDTHDPVLLSLIESKLDCAEKKLRKFAQTPTEFPFKIVEDDPGWGTIELTREYQGEKVEVIASTRSDQQSVYLRGSVSNKSGLTMKFNIKADAADGIQIESLDVESKKWDFGLYFERTRFSDLGVNVQEAFLKYLEARGIEPSFAGNIFEYMVKIRHKKYTETLKNLRNFIANRNINNTNLFDTTSIQIHHRLSAVAEKRSNADDTLLGVIQSDIDCAEEKFRKNTEAPSGFAFKIMDNPKEKFIRLTREYQGEEIEVKVNGPHINYDEEKEELKRNSRYIDLGVSVSKKSGPTLRFDVNSNVTDGTITKINCLKVHDQTASEDGHHNRGFGYYREYYKRPDFSDFNEYVQKTFHEYLEVRGFEHSTVKFLCDYMVHREHLECTTKLLKNLKTFMAN